jgi:hypothetical protein
MIANRGQRSLQDSRQWTQAMKGEIVEGVQNYIIQLNFRQSSRFPSDHKNVVIELYCSAPVNNCWIWRCLCAEVILQFVIDRFSLMSLGPLINDQMLSMDHRKWRNRPPKAAILHQAWCRSKNLRSTSFSNSNSFASKYVLVMLQDMPFFHFCSVCPH